MIDYLERLFVLPQESGEEKTEGNFRFSPPYEQAEEMAMPVLEAGETAAMPVVSSQADWQEERARRPESVLAEPLPLPHRLDSVLPERMPGVWMAREEPESGSRERMAVVQTWPREGQQDLERRLRRDSRRYDSGFFWY